MKKNDDSRHGGKGDEDLFTGQGMRSDSEHDKLDLLMEERLDKKKARRERAVDAVIELALEIVIFIIGAGMLALFGVRIDDDSLDTDMIIMVGLGTAAVIMGLIILLYHIGRKHRKNAAFKEKDDKSKGNGTEI